MRRIAHVVALALLATACGDDDKSSNDHAGVDPNIVRVTTHAGRTFVSQTPAQIEIREVRLGSRIETEIAGWFYAIDQADPTLGYDVRFLIPEGPFLEGHAMPQLSAAFPDAPGMGKVEVDTEDGFLTARGTTDSLHLNFDQGFLEGMVSSPQAELAATIKGGYDLSCQIIQNGSLVDDAGFESAFCQRFAAQRPRAE